jgi:hypothetical protein
VLCGGSLCGLLQGFLGAEGTIRVEAIINEMRAAVAPGQQDLDAAAVSRLRELTARLVTGRREEARTEYERFLSVIKRELCLPKAVYLSGYDPGYEEVPFPGLYDPATAGELSPLLNAFEASAVVPSDCPMTNVFEAAFAPEPRAAERYDELAAVCGETDDPQRVRAALRELSWALLDATLAVAPPEALTRAALTANRHVATLTADHHQSLQAIQKWASESSDLAAIGEAGRQLFDRCYWWSSSRPATWTRVYLRRTACADFAIAVVSRRVFYVQSVVESATLNADHQRIPRTIQDKVG